MASFGARWAEVFYHTEMGARLARMLDPGPDVILLFATAPALQMALNRGEDFLLARFLGDVERNEAAIGQTDVSDDRAVSAVVEMKERPRFKLEFGGPRFTQLAELAKLV